MTLPTPALLLADSAPALTHSSDQGQLLLAGLLAVAVLVLLIAKLKLHPFLALTVGSMVLAVTAGAPFDQMTSSFATGFGATATSVGLLIGLGAMLGKLLADSGGANVIADSVLARAGTKRLPWAMALIAFVVGMPLFFEIGVVMLVPIVVLVAKRGNVPALRLGIPALAGLSVLHGLIPPHPGPLVAVAALHANIGLTLALGLLVAVPTLVVAGPLFARVAERWVGPLEIPEAVLPADDEQREHTPRLGAVLATVLLPVGLMLLKALFDVVLDKPIDMAQRIFDFVGSPLVALLLAVLLGMVTLGRGAGFTKQRIATTVEKSLAPIAGIVFIVSAGGGFKQTLVDAGVGGAISSGAAKLHISALLLGWLVAVLIRLATGSATVATITAAGIVSPLAAGMSAPHTALLVLAIGAGSLFFSHVNDAGFWMVKEYFGMSVGQTIKSWSVMETLVSVTAIAVILPLGLLL